MQRDIEISVGDLAINRILDIDLPTLTTRPLRLKPEQSRIVAVDSQKGYAIHCPEQRIWGELSPGQRLDAMAVEIGPSKIPGFAFGVVESVSPDEVVIKLETNIRRIKGAVRWWDGRIPSKALLSIYCTRLDCEHFARVDKNGNFDVLVALIAETRFFAKDGYAAYQRIDDISIEEHTINLILPKPPY